MPRRAALSSGASHVADAFGAAKDRTQVSLLRCLVVCLNIYLILCYLCTCGVPVQIFSSQGHRGLCECGT